MLELWQGKFGDKYHRENNATEEQIEARMELWQRILQQTDTLQGGEKHPDTFLEFGAGTGNNIRALKRIFPDAYYMAVEPNETAAFKLVDLGVETDFNSAESTDFQDNCADVAFTCGLLIHVLPSNLLRTMKAIHRCSRKWIACVEYFSPEPEVKTYREHKALFKNDFGSIWLDAFDVECVSYGFTWKRMEHVDNANWWLFRKR